MLGRDDVDRNEDIEEGGAGTLLVGSNGEEMDGVVYYIKNGVCVRSAPLARRRRDRRGARQRRRSTLADKTVETRGRALSAPLERRRRDRRNTLPEGGVSGLARSAR